MAAPQSAKNHARWDPLFHYFIMPALLLNLGVAIYATIHAWPAFGNRDLWWIFLSLVFLLWAFKTRAYALANQDRLIRLEEQLRLADLLPESKLDIVESLSTPQFIAIRFASDAEAAALATRAVAQNLDPKQIKEAIVTWREDHNRI